MIGSSDAQFHMLKDPEQTRTTLSAVDDRKSVSVLGLNDDIENGEEDVKEILNEWMKRRWPQPAPWERSFTQS